MPGQDRPTAVAGGRSPRSARLTAGPAPVEPAPGHHVPGRLQRIAEREPVEAGIDVGEARLGQQRRQARPVVAAEMARQAHPRARTGPGRRARTTAASRPAGPARPSGAGPRGRPRCAPAPRTRRRDRTAVRRGSRRRCSHLAAAEAAPIPGRPRHEAAVRLDAQVVGSAAPAGRRRRRAPQPTSRAVTSASGSIRSTTSKRSQALGPAAPPGRSRHSAPGLGAPRGRTSVRGDPRFAGQP